MNKFQAKLIGALSFALLYASIATAQTEQPKDVFLPYTSCSIADGPSVIETAPLAPGVTTRTVTTSKGPYRVPLTAGRRVMFAYPDEDFYANVKVELLPETGYEESKAALIGDFDHTLASGDSSRNYELKSILNGFNIRGLDRSKREGGVLGIYLLFDDASRIVTTIYFLNQEPPKRFQTIEEYRTVRDRFLIRYTTCIRNKY